MSPTRFLAAAALLSGVACGDRAPRSHPEPELRPTVATVPAPSPWTSKDACEEALAANPPPEARAFARVGTWNVRYFPDGAPAEGEGPETDIAWLACAVAHLDVDVLAVQELKRHGDATDAADELTDELDARTGGRWKLALDGCGGDGLPHIGLLYDEARVEVTEPRELDVVRAAIGRACDDETRPGFAARVAVPGGVAFDVVVVHLPAGYEPVDRELRVRALDGLATAVDTLYAASPDRELVVLGDFNTLGCPGCPEPLSAAMETAALEEAVHAMPRPLAVRSPPCSEYKHGEPVLLDHVVLSPGMEARLRGDVFVSGPCAERSCGQREGTALDAADAKLSDHCPVLFDLDPAAGGDASGTGASAPVQVTTRAR